MMNQKLVAQLERSRTGTQVAALIEYALAKSPGATIVYKYDRRWLFEPNFLEIKIQPRKGNVVLSLRGRPSEYAACGLELKLLTGRAGAYTRVELDASDQLRDACVCVDRAIELYGRGRSRFN
jgi:hypothetical protein